MKKQQILGALLAGAMSVSLLTAAPVDAKPDGPWRAHAQERSAMHGPMMDRLFDKLNLTPEQKDKIKELRKQGHEKTKAQREQLMAKQRELHQMVRSAKATREQAIAKQREVNTLQNQLAESRMQTWFDMRAVLTPDQLKQLEELKPKKGEKPRKR